MTSSNDVTASYTSFGSSATSAGFYDGTNATAWVDLAASPTVTFDQSSSGSTPSERWTAQAQPSFTLTAAGQTLPAIYYDQVIQTFTARHRQRHGDGQ